jgi:hypothetical protein
VVFGRVSRDGAEFVGVFGFWEMLVRLRKGGGRLTSNFAEFSAEEDLCLDVFVFDLHLVKVL